jgi:hypothetical protein
MAQQQLTDIVHINSMYVCTTTKAARAHNPLTFLVFLLSLKDDNSALVPVPPEHQNVFS